MPLPGEPIFSGLATDLPLAPHAPEGAGNLNFRWSEWHASQAVRFIEGATVHTKGRHARAPFILEPWQKDEIIRPMFGTFSYDDQYNEWTPQYRLAWIELGRKNGKSELASALALYFLLGVGEESAEVYSVAADRDQAGLVFNVAKRMVELSPILSAELDRGRLEIVDSRKRIIDRKYNSVYAVLPGDAGGALGTNPSAVLFDEVLTQRDRHLWDAMRQGFGTRRAPMMVATTTAAYTSAKFALEEHEYGERLTENPAMDPSRFVYMRNCPKDWDWQDEGQPANLETGEPATGWYWANPALGSFLNINNLRAEAQEAAEKPQAQNAFRVFRLNQWVAQEERWLDMGLWDENGRGAPVDREALKGRECIGGLDLASTSDFTAWVLIFPGSPTDEKADGFTVLPHFFVPRVALEKRQNMQSMFEVWERDGLLTVTEGPTTNYDDVEKRMEADAEDFRLRAFGYDPWNATQVVQHMESRGLVAVKVPQTNARLNDPSKRLETLLAERGLFHGGHPVLRWHADNVQADVTGDGLMKPSRQKSGEKIDGIAALINALFVEAVPIEETPSVEFISFADEPSRDEVEQEGLDEFLAGWRDQESRYFGDDDDDD
jgi:phage terminase large subunit-like protein